MLFVSLRIEDYNSYQGWAQFKIIHVIINYDIYIYIYIYIQMCVYMYIRIYIYI